MLNDSTPEGNPYWKYIHCNGDEHYSLGLEDCMDVSGESVLAFVVGNPKSWLDFCTIVDRYSAY